MVVLLHNRDQQHQIEFRVLLSIFDSVCAVPCNRSNCKLPSLIHYTSDLVNFSAPSVIDVDMDVFSMCPGSFGFALERKDTLDIRLIPHPPQHTVGLWIFWDQLFFFLVFWERSSLDSVLRLDDKKKLTK